MILPWFSCCPTPPTSLGSPDTSPRVPLRGKGSAWVVNGQFHHDVGAFVRLALDADGAPKDLCPFLDAFQTEMLFAHTVYVKTNTPILHLDVKLLVVLGDFDLHFFAFAMAKGVADALLNNVENRILKHRL